ncbi:MAG: hypothetical protein MJZ84_00260 [Paludibacteraceae bacterium]|nr:hypothetical protein [Paludibacteraceae bacterium]
MADIAHIESISSLENLRYQVSSGVDQVYTSLQLVFNSIDHERTACDMYLTKGQSLVEKWSVRAESARRQAEAIQCELDNLPADDDQNDYSSQRAALTSKYEDAVSEAEEYESKRDAVAEITGQIAENIRQIGMACDTLLNYTLRAESEINNQGRNAVSAIDRVIVVARQYIARRLT